ncbi:MAG: SpoIIE family protein phosphatase, partial [Bacteroidota bacterium]
FRIGQYQPMLEQKELNSSWHLMWIGVLIIMGFYHIILYYFRRKNPSTLFFGIITLLIAIRFIVFGEHYLYEYLKHHVGWLSFAIQSKTYYIATFVLIPLGLNYVVCLYPKEPIKKLFKLSNKKIIQVCSAITAIYCFFLLVTPPSLFTQTLLFYQGVIGVFLLYMAYVLVSAALRRRNESGVQMLGVSTMIFAGINDGLHAQGIELVGQLELMPIAFGIFLSLQFFIIARRFSRAFNEVEDLSENLEQKVAIRTKELVDKNEEIEQQKEILRHNSEALQHAYKQITDSVRYAQRIQKAVLGAPQQLQTLIKESFVLFLPKDIVSGDFYVFREWQGRKIIIAADATGHGVPGAFMTVLGAELLNEIIEQSPKAAPHEILHQLDEKLSHILTNQGEERKINDGMDMGILIFDDATQEALYAGAKMSLYYVRNETLTQVGAVKLPIGGAAQYKKQKVFTTQHIDFQPGDFIYLASDGYQDQFGGEEKRKFLKKRFKELLLKVHTLPANEQKEYLETTFRNWKKDHPQTDDVIVVGLQVG